MAREKQGEFVSGDRVIFQYAQGAALRGTIEGWTDKYTAYMLRCDTGRKLLVPPTCLRYEALVDPLIRAEREQDWPWYVVYLATCAGTQEVWSGKAQTPRQAFARASPGCPSLQDVLRCKNYKRLHARRRYPLGELGEHVYCEKVETPTLAAAVEPVEERPPQPDPVRRSHVKSASGRRRAA